VKDGKWYYEVTLLSDCLSQIGYTYTREFTGNAGVGDDDLSFAYDGNRRKKWNGERTNTYGLAWHKGDTVGCIVDLVGNSMTFSLNGVSMGVAFQDFVRKGLESILISSNYVGLTLYPAISTQFKNDFLFNFGQTPFKYVV
jgi:hypothetical protein